jgi:hypothetical protein
MTLQVNLAKPAPDALPGQISFTQKLLRFTVTLSASPLNNASATFQGTGVPSADGTNQVTLSGLRAHVRIQNNGAPAGSMADVSIYGLTPSLMNQLSTLGQVYNSISRNSLQISAGDESTGVVPIFLGTITSAFGDYQKMPDVPFEMHCQSGTIDAVSSATPSSFPGNVDVATVMSGLASQMNLGFINGGVSVKLPGGIYLRGNLEQQVKQLASWANILAERVNGGTALAIWKRGSTWQTGIVPLLSKSTGMITAPSLSIYGPVVRSIFNSQVAFGGSVQIQSDVVPQANGMWYVQKVDLALDSLVPKGRWEMTVHTNGLNATFPTPPPP